MATRPERYATTEATERKLLAALWFVGDKQAQYVLDERNPIARVRSELHRVYPAQMAAVDARIAAPPVPNIAEIMANAQRVIESARAAVEVPTGSAAQQRELDHAFGLTTDGTPWTRAVHAVEEHGAAQTFGTLRSPAEAAKLRAAQAQLDSTTRQQQALDIAFGITKPAQVIQQDGAQVFAAAPPPRTEISAQGREFLQRRTAPHQE